MFEVQLVNRKYAQHILTLLRNKDSSQIEFRKGLVKLGRILGMEIAEDLESEEAIVETPLGVKVKGVRIKDMDNTIIVTVLRAAWPLTEGLIKVFYNARQGVIAAKRVEEKGMQNYGFEIDVSYVKMPSVTSNDVVIISDVMVATGSTLARILEEILKKGKAKKYYIASVLTTPLAVARLRDKADELGMDLKMYAIWMDPEVNQKGYIVPGLGDAGDRAFGS
ncbi:MAG: uracil phosphoribosyltransferase [Thermosphaera sp.]